MNPVFKCDYCSKMGTEEEIREHEENCSENYDKKSCETCVHSKLSMQNEGYECKVGKEIPKRKVYLFCDAYERKVKTNNEYSNFFGNLFGW